MDRETVALPEGVAGYEYGLMSSNFGLCIADADTSVPWDDVCGYPAVSDLGYCAVCYYEIVGRPHSEYTKERVEREREKRKKTGRKKRTHQERLEDARVASTTPPGGTT